MERPYPKRGGTLRVGLDWEVDIIDPPASFGGWNTARVVQQMFESLVEDDLEDEASPYTRLVPALADPLRYFVRWLRYDISPAEERSISRRDSVRCRGRDLQLRPHAASGGATVLSHRRRLQSDGNAKRERRSRAR